MTEPVAVSNGEYGNGHLWLRPQGRWQPGYNPPLPEDGFFLNGHDGQSVSVFPEEGVVVVRLGLTPSSKGYKVGPLLEAVLRAVD